ncbi:MAG: type VI secretion system protein TssA [Verrucomicrobia bacterium]|nr:type VI secretion system protein TssA [Verrucomicrobiota bacterium]
MISAADLLKPVTDDNPCGDDLSYDPAFQELDVLMKGKPETQFSSAEPPDWAKLYKQCQELLGRSKDLRIVTTLCLAAVKVDGLPGLKEGFTVLKELLANFWEPVHPRLDPEDDNDPTQRVNAIAALAMPRGTYGDPMRFLERLHEVPLTNSVQLGRFSLADLERAESGQAGEGAAGVDQIEAAFRDTNAEELAALSATTDTLLELVNQIDSVLTEAVGAGRAASLDALTAELKELKKCLAPYAGTDTASDAAAPAETAGVAASGSGGAKAISGEIQSRQDVVRMLDKICDYYARHEPSSPVPSVLRRAQRLSDKGFLEIIKDLCPEAENTVRTITGETAE